MFYKSAAMVFVALCFVACGGAETAALEERIAELEQQVDSATPTTNPPTTTAEVATQQESTSSAPESDTSDAPTLPEPDVCPTQPERLAIYDALLAEEITRQEALAATCDYALFDREFDFRVASTTGGDSCAAAAGYENVDTDDVFGTCSSEEERSTPTAPPLTLDACGDPTRGAEGTVTNVFDTTMSVTVNVVVVDASGIRVADGFDFVPDIAAGQTATWEAIIPGAWTGSCEANIDWLG